ncbi:MAG: N-acetylmuramoyl-L-alanine amidase [Candidatus Hydrogenedentes bacterium]|nr:N-acetylmuramoyl-L-alanine amidase [Candidatus Hydrogenedentota bacterium]
MKRLFAVAAILLAVGCKTTPPPPPQVEAPPQAIQLPVPAVDTLDMSSLAGRRICLDPGHGGPWPGAVAPSNNLREADVNLRVAMLVRSLLEQAGATVTMTRVDDTVPNPASLGEDLAARAAIANNAKADVFVSIHHNADIETGSDKNDLEVYYKWREEGASLDLAQTLTRALARELDATAGARRLLPGNYKVLRLAAVPSVLLESSYLTHAGNAVALATDQAVAVEAHAIASGLANYFALDPPQVGGASVGVLNEGRTHELQVRFTRGIPIDIGTVAVALDGVEISGSAASVESGFIWTFFETLPNGNHTAHVRARNGKGAGIEFPVPFAVNRDAATVDVAQVPERITSASGAEVLFEVRVRDSLGLPIADGTSVSLGETGVAATTRGGVARFYVPAKEIPRGACTFASGSASVRFTPSLGDSRFRSARFVNASNQEPVGGGIATAAGVTQSVATPEGWVVVPMPQQSIHVRCPGYEPAMVELKQDHNIITLNPVAAGALHGKVILIDPAYGGREPGAVSANGMRGSDCALDVARRLRARLLAAGANAHLTRDGDVEASDPQRVTSAEDLGADIMLSLSFGSKPAAAKTLDSTGHSAAAAAAFVGHYPSSAEGSRLATALARVLGGIPAVPSVAYVVQQTGCPSVLVQPADFAQGDTEAQYRGGQARDAVAEALYRGLLDFYKTDSAPAK